MLWRWNALECRGKPLGDSSQLGFRVWLPIVHDMEDEVLRNERLDLVPNVSAPSLPSSSAAITDDDVVRLAECAQVAFKGP